jgi:hypothetical protein
MDLFRPYLGEPNGSDHTRQSPVARRSEEEEAERLYEEAVGERPTGDETI